MLKERTGGGIGSVTSKAEVITPGQMEYLWKNGLLGSDTPELPRNTILFVFGNCFALRAGQEHRNLRMKNSQLSLHTDESGAEYLQYVEDVSKSNNGGLAHLRIKNKVVRAYENVEKPERCPVKLYKKYISHVPSETSDNSFYLRPNRNQREIFGITKRLLEGKRWEMLFKRSWVRLGLMDISLTIHCGEVVPQTFTIMGYQNK